MTKLEKIYTALDTILDIALETGNDELIAAAKKLWDFSYEAMIEENDNA